MRIRGILWSLAMVVAIGCASHRETIQSEPIERECRTPMMATGERQVLPAGPARHPGVATEFLVAGFCTRRAREIQLGAGALSDLRP